MGAFPYCVFLPLPHNVCQICIPNLDIGLLKCGEAVHRIWCCYLTNPHQGSYDRPCLYIAHYCPR